MVFKISTKSHLVTILLILHLLIGLPSVLEFYLYAINETNSIGSFGSSCVILIIVELILIIKCGDGYFNNSTPFIIKFFLIIIILILLIFPLFWFKILKKGEKNNKLLK